MKYNAPQYACKGLDLPSGRKIDFTRGQVDVTDRRDVAALEAIGAFPASNQPNRRGGYRCPSCGFATWFRTCGRCGSPTIKEP
ncbi:MAG TPA: hypothetical protein VMT43_06605 [Acidimicrobiales bacterium]|nr:hypothetical protein [Acidimicrobiales bacterium]